MARMFRLLQLYSANPLEDQLRLWNICIFNYLIGNTDNHIKNLSLLYSADLKSIRLAPAYDLVSTVVYDGGNEDMAFSVGGEHNIHAISRKSFEKAAKEIGLGSKMAMNRFDAMVFGFEKALISAGEELKEQGFAEASHMSESILNKGGIARQ